ncbi:MAG: domain, repeat protein [Verrucomicrobiales bacterium]|nr:domain, repeat protein [Verrucomicrobiales bacterium]
MHLRPFSYSFALCLCAAAACGQTVNSFTPTYGQPGDPVTITGTGFTGATSVEFNGHAASFAVSDQLGTQINAFVPVGGGVGPITVRKGGASGTSANSFTVIGAGPYIASFPQTGAIGSSITLTGAHFTVSTTVKFNGTSAAVFTPTTDTQLTVTVPNGATSGAITAANTSGSWVSSNLFYFMPGIQSFSPVNARPGTNVVIKGTNFLGVTTVAFGGLNAIIFTTNNNTQITAVVPENAVTGLLHVTTPAGQFISTSNVFVNPNIVSFSPSIGDVGTEITINGTNLNGSGLVVRFNGVQASVTSTSFNQLKAVVPSGAMSGAITAQTSDGTTSTTANFFLPPAISGISPTSAAIGATVTISGKNFTNATSVQFNGVNATSYTVVTNTQITAVVPPGPTSGQVTVVTPGGSAQSAQAFFGAPVITSVTPPAGVVGVDVTIFGTNFFGLTNIQFNGVNAVIGNMTINSVMTTVPAGATTGPITLKTFGGIVNSSSFFIEPLILGVTNLNDTTLRLSWTTNAPGFGLQSTTNLLSANTAWANETNATQLIGGKVTFTNNTTSFPQKYFRLRK